jgi:hypothetical protein
MQRRQHIIRGVAAGSQSGFDGISLVVRDVEKREVSQSFESPLLGPVFGVKILYGHRDWRLISVVREKDNLNNLRAVLGNDVVIKAYREGKLPLPDGAIIAPLAWSYAPS